MLPNRNTSFPNTPIYKKAQEIIALSQRISAYLRDDLSGLREQGTEDPHIYFSGDIVQQSVSLAPELWKAESETFSEEKHRRAATLNRLTYLLNKNCDRLEQANSNGKEFIQLLRKEVKKFRKLQHSWMLTL